MESRAFFKIFRLKRIIISHRISFLHISFNGLPDRIVFFIFFLIFCQQISQELPLFPQFFFYSHTQFFQDIRFL